MRIKIVVLAVVFLAAFSFAAEAQVRNYRIIKNDTLSAIAQRFYGRASLYRVLARANGLSNPDLIFAGETLIVPDKTTALGLVDKAADLPNLTELPAPLDEVCAQNLKTFSEHPVLIAVIGLDAAVRLTQDHAPEGIKAVLSYQERSVIGRLPKTASIAAGSSRIKTIGDADTAVTIYGRYVGTGERTGDLLPISDTAYYHARKIAGCGRLNSGITGTESEIRRLVKKVYYFELVNRHGALKAMWLIATETRERSGNGGGLPGG